MTKLLSFLLITLSLAVLSLEAQAKERGNCLCVAQGQLFGGGGHHGRHGRHGGQIVEGRDGRDGANIGRRGSRLDMLMNGYCANALNQCVAQFQNREFGLRSCRVVEASVNGQSLNQYLGRQLR